MNWKKSNVFTTLFVYLFLLGLSCEINIAQIPGVTTGLPKRSKAAPVKKQPKQTASKRRESAPIFVVNRDPIVRYKKTSSLVISTNPNAEVSLSPLNQRIQSRRIEKVDPEGSLIIEDLKPGKYKLSVQLKGYKPNESIIDVLPEKIRFAPINLESLTAKTGTDSQEQPIPKDNVINDRDSRTGNANSIRAENISANNVLGSNTNSNGSRKANADSAEKTTSNTSLKTNVVLPPRVVNQNTSANNSAVNTFNVADYLSKCQENIKSEKLNEALELCSKAVELDNKEHLTYFLRSKVYTLKGDYTLAVEDLSKAINLNSQNAIYYNNRGYAFNLKSDYDSALKDYTTAIRIDPKTPVFYYNRGEAYNKVKRFKDAIVDFTVAIDLNLNNSMVFNNRGNAYFMLGDYSNSIADYTKAIVMNPKIARFYRNRAEAFRARAGSSDLEKAQIDIQIAESLEKQPR